MHDIEVDRHVQYVLTLRSMHSAYTLHRHTKHSRSKYIHTALTIHCTDGAYNRRTTYNTIHTVSTCTVHTHSTHAVHAHSTYKTHSTNSTNSLDSLCDSSSMSSIVRALSLVLAFLTSAASSSWFNTPYVSWRRGEEEEKERRGGGKVGKWK